MRGRVINRGAAKGEALVTSEPISFLGGVDASTGVITEKGHELEGENLKNKVLVFPRGKGSTVGSYVLYALKKNGVAPNAIINEECEPIVAVGAIIANIPAIDRIDIKNIKNGDVVNISEEGVVKIG